MTLLPDLPIVSMREAPHEFVVMLSLPSKGVPLMDLDDCSLVAVAALPVQVRAEVAAPLGDEEPA